MGPVGLVVVVPGMTMSITPTKFYEYFALVGCILPDGVCAAVRSGLDRHAGNGSAHRTGGLNCVGTGILNHQESAAEGCAPGEVGVVDSWTARVVSQ